MTMSEVIELINDLKEDPDKGYVPEENLKIRRKFSHEVMLAKVMNDF